MTLIMYLVNYTISDICHGNHSECARRLCMNYPDLNKHINRIKAGGTSGRLMEALLEMYWREELSLDTPLKQYSETRFGSDMEAAQDVCSELFSDIHDRALILPQNTQDTSHILKTAKSLNELIHRDFCSKYCDKKKFTNEECPLRKYREFILSLEQEMTSILNCGRYSERK